MSSSTKNLVFFDTGDKEFLNFILVGDPGVGKTALMNRYANDTFLDGHCEPSLAVNLAMKNIQRVNPETLRSKSVILQIWDTAGKDQLSQYQSCYPGADGILLIYAVTNINTFLSLENWLVQLRLLSCTESLAWFPLVVLGNKTDLKNREVSWDQAKSWCQNKNNMPFFETSAKDSTNVDQAFEKLVNAASAYKDKPQGIIELPCLTQINCVDQLPVLSKKPDDRQKCNNDCRCCKGSFSNGKTWSLRCLQHFPSKKS